MPPRKVKQQPGGDGVAAVLSALRSATGDGMAGIDEARMKAARAAAVKKFADPPPIESRIRALLERPDSLRILELGCGEGVLTTRLALAGHQIDALDPSIENVALARTAIAAAGVADTASVRHGALDRLDELSPPYDVVVSDRTLLYSDMESVVASARRLLGTGGRIVLIANGIGKSACSHAGG